MKKHKTYVCEVILSYPYNIVDINMQKGTMTAANGDVLYLNKLERAAIEQYINSRSGFEHFKAIAELSHDN